MPRTALYAGFRTPSQRPSGRGPEGGGACRPACAGDGVNPGKLRCFRRRAPFDAERRAGRWPRLPGAELAGSPSTTGDSLARREGATILIRGLRDGNDFDYEMQMAGMNGHVAGHPDGVSAGFASRTPDHRHFGRQIAQNGRRYHALVRRRRARLKTKFAGKNGG